MQVQPNVETFDTFPINDVATATEAYGLLYAVGYRGLINTSGDTLRLEMTKPDAIPVRAGLGDTVLYIGTEVRAVVSAEVMAANYHEVIP